MEKNTLKKIMDTEKPITYRGIKYDIFESKGELTEFKGQKYRGLDENSYYVSINNIAYKIIKSIKKFEQINLKKDSETEGSHLRKNPETGKLYLKCCIFLCEIELSYNKKICTIENSIFLENFYYHGITDINGVKEKHPLSDIDFNGVEFEKDCIITNENLGEKPSVSFHKCHFGRKLKIRNTESFDFYKDSEKEYEKAQENKLKLEKLHITDCTAGNEAYLRVGFLAVNNFVLSNLRLPQNAELNIGDCHFKCFKLNNFRNVGKFKLYKINVFKNELKKKNPTFQIDNTSIGDTDFQSLNLTSFDRVIMFDNIFSSIDYTNVQWKKSVEVGQFNDDEETKIAKKQDTYRTLKNVVQKNNDQPQALFFYTKEMKYHQKIVSGNKEYSLSDKTTLLFNKWTNNFGLSFWKPILILLFVLTPLFYWALLCSLGMTIFNIAHWEFIAEFLNPTHKFNWVQGFMPNFIDILFRVFEGLLIYQTIQAFRKYSRKL